MPFSFPYFKTEVKEWFKDNVTTDKRILDVGPGEGTYAILLQSLGYRIDAVEIWPPYIDEYKLRELYDNVYTGSILDFDIKDYDFIILGDILEHIPAEEAQELMDAIIASNKECLVAVPYLMEQGIHNGNEFETHHQADLTPEVMSERYPFLSLIYANEYYGYYTHMHIKEEKAYILYANASYFSTVSACVASIKAVSDIPVIVYMVNSNLDVEGAKTIYWECDVKDIPKHSFIDRNDSEIYKLLLQRPAIIKDALEKYAEVVAYVDADSVATHSIDRMFDLYPKDTKYPYFVEGMYDWLQANGKGGVETMDELYKSLEAPACSLFSIDQSVRKTYRQTGYFVAGQHSIEFLNEWYWMCTQPKILQNPQYYAPYHEETIANVLLWKYNITNGLPYIYVNADLDRMKKIYNNETVPKFDWYRKPDNNNDIFFFHGEKRSAVMHEMIKEISLHNKLRILFLAPHLSTGGMPAFLQKRIESLQASTMCEIFVVEYHCYSLDFVVQRNKIINLVGQDNFTTLYEDKMMLFKYINEFRPDIIHIDEMSERMEHTVIEKLYNPNREYRILEPCHDISFDAYKEKRFVPDALALCTPYHLKTFSTVPSPKEVLLFPIDTNKPSETIDKFKYQTKLFPKLIGFHIVNIGLWTKGKNQGEMIELARELPLMNFHFVGNQAGNFEEYWGPLMEDLPYNVYVWGEREDAQDFMKAADIIMFNSTWECNPLVLREAISIGKPIIARNLPQYEDMFTPYITDLDPYFLRNQIVEIIHDPKKYVIPTDNTYFEFAQNHIELYNKVLKFKPMEQFIDNDYKITSNFVNGAFVEITGTSTSLFEIKFTDNGKLIHSDTIKVNHWVKTSREYFTNWNIQVYKDGRLVYVNNQNLRDKRVYIAFDSASLGDTIAWMPYVEEFRQLHNCEMIVSTFKNFLFERSYPMIEFVKPGVVVNNIYAMYKIGWFYNSNMEPVLPNTIPLQQTATNILGLEYKELIPDIDFEDSFDNNFDSPDKKFIVIATNSTAECKFWPKENWQNIITYLVRKGYRVINISKERNEFKNCWQVEEDMPLQEIMSLIHHSKFMIGLSSGLSWLAWALKKHVVMIANFTEKDHEFSINTTRLVNEDVCHGCWNSPDHKFDRGNWRWCPIHENTERQFECQKSITPQMVKEKLKPLI